MTLLGWRRPDLLIAPTGAKLWEVRGVSAHGRRWLHGELGEAADVVILQHDAAVELVFRAIRADLTVCSEPI